MKDSEGRWEGGEEGEGEGRGSREEDQNAVCSHTHKQTHAHAPIHAHAHTLTQVTIRAGIHPTGQPSVPRRHAERGELLPVAVGTGVPDGHHEEGF